MQQLHRGLEGQYPVTRICSALSLSRSSWYHRSKRKAKVITQEEFRVHRRIKELYPINFKMRTSRFINYAYLARFMRAIQSF